MIEFKNVNKWYGDFQVLKDCSALVQKGEVVVFVVLPVLASPR